MNKPGYRWWQDPAAFLYAWDFGRDTGRFLTLSRSALKDSAFLDHRIAADRTKLSDASITELLAEPITRAVKNPAFVFHTAFCCSTLLARSLDMPGRSLVLREPAPLLQMADLRRGLTTAGAGFAALMPLTLDLLARPFLAGEQVILKPTNLANNLAPDILNLRPQSRALVLYDELEPFLLSVLKRPQESENGIRHFLTRLLADSGGAAGVHAEAASLSLPERAALAWTLQIRSLDRWLASEMTQIRVLSASELLAEPAKALAAAARWLGVDIDEAEAATIVAGPLWNKHAKDPRVAYNPARRNEEQGLARRLFAEPVREGLIFARERLAAPRSSFPPTLHLLN